MAQEDSPTIDQAPEVAEPEVVETQDETTEEEALENSKNPERTKKYIDKLQEENKKYKNVLDSLTPDPTPQQKPTPAPKANQYQNLSQGEIDDVFKSMVDDQGYLDGNKLLETLKQMDARTKRAEQEALSTKAQLQNQTISNEQRHRSEEATKVHNKYPQLDPESESFDPEFWDAVRGKLVSQMVDTGKSDFMGAADALSRRYLKEEREDMPKTKAEKETEEKKQVQKEQINATRPRSSSMEGYYKDTEDEALRSKVRSGKKGALAELLKRHEQK